MTEFKSNTLSINKPAPTLFLFLSDFNNFEKLMPEQVINWQSSTERCSFTIKGMADMAMYMKEKAAPTLVVYASEGNSKISFNLQFSIVEKSGSQSEITTTLQAQLNAMLKMMASRPLQNFVNIITEKFKEIQEEG